MIAGMVITLFTGLLIGIPVAIMLATTGLSFALLGIASGSFDPFFLQALPNRLYGILDNQLLICVPLFILMGNILEQTKIAENLLNLSGKILEGFRGGLGVAVMLVGLLMAASTGIVGATVITMGLIALPSLVRHHYPHSLAAGSIATAGTLGQLVPPSIALILLADVMGSAYQQAQLSQGKFFLKTVSVAELFSGAIFPSLLLVGLYLLYIVYASTPIPVEERTPHEPGLYRKLVVALLPPIGLIIAVLGSILGGFATPTEAAAVGALGALLLALGYRRLSLSLLQGILEQTLFITCMVFFILFGASIFSLSFRGFGGDEMIESALRHLPGGFPVQLGLVMGILFLLGFVLDFIEIIFIVVPIVAPILLKGGANPVWLGLLIAVNLQTSFLTPPFGFALFYLRGVASEEIKTASIYKGVAPFIGIQLLSLIVLIAFPELATWLPKKLYP